MKVPRSVWLGFAMVGVPVLALLFVALPEMVRQGITIPGRTWWSVLRWMIPALVFAQRWVIVAGRLMNGEPVIRRRVIADPCYPAGGPLFTRYYLLDSPWFALYVHHFHRSDHDRHVHDHPWSFVAFLLSGGYWEHLPKFAEIPDGEQIRVWRRRFSVLWRPAEWQHWVEIKRPVWTLVLRLRRRRAWGFWTDKGWVDWQTYGKEWCD
jgi:hypothetical protein